MSKIKAVCGQCDGTGLYRGMAEPPGVAVVCLGCDGTGCHEMQYMPFTGRKPSEGVREVRRSRGTFILDCGPAGPSITYAAFTAGHLP